jgi:hypothetical protein
MPDGNDDTSTYAEAILQLDALYIRFGESFMERAYVARKAAKPGKGRPFVNGDGSLLFEMYRVMAYERCSRQHAAVLLTKHIAGKDRLNIRKRLKNRFPERLFEQLKSTGLGDNPTPMEFLLALVQVAHTKLQDYADHVTPVDNERQLKEQRNLAYWMLDLAKALLEEAAE